MSQSISEQQREALMRSTIAHLTRLRWSNDQGVKYLREIYGSHINSRKDLSLEQLQDLDHRLSGMGFDVSAQASTVSSAEPPNGFGGERTLGWP